MVLTVASGRALLGGSAAAAPATPFVLSGVLLHQFLQSKAIIAAADTPQGVMSWWQRAGAGSVANPGMTGGTTIWDTSMIGNYTAADGTNVEAYKGANTVVDNTGFAGADAIRLNLGSSAGADVQGTLGVGPPGSIKNWVWQHFLWAWNTNQASGQKHQALYIDGVRSTGATGDVGIGTGFNVNLATAEGFYLNIPVLPAHAELAQFFLDSSTDITTGAAGNWTISAANIAKFYNAGSPVDLGATGTIPFGTTPLIYYNGVASTWATNLGSEGQPAFLGVSNAFTKKFFNANIGPGETPDRPYYKWFAYETGGNAKFTMASLQYTATKNWGNPIAIGDVMIIVVSAEANASTADHTLAVTGWTLVPNSRQNVGGGRPMNVAAFYKVVGAGDTGLIATGNRTDWSTPPVITWATDTADGWSQVSYHLINIGNANTTSPFADSRGVVNAAAGAFTAPAVTASAGKYLLISVFCYYTWSDPTGALMLTFGPPTTEDVIFFPSTDGSTNSGTNVPAITFQKVTGTTAARSAQISGTGSIRASPGLSFLLQL